MHSPLSFASLLRRLTLPLGVGCLLFGLVGLEGCSRQNEGERCDPLNGNRDCDDSENYACTNAASLRHNDGIDRCCPVIRENFTDNRCAPRTATGDGGGMGGAATGGAASTGGMGGGVATGGGTGAPENSSCIYTSECRPPLYCLAGLCRPQCNQNVDCVVYGKSTCTKDMICVD